MQRAKLHDLFVGSFKISQRFGDNPQNYSWIKDKAGLSIKGHNGVDWGFGGANGIELLNPFPKGNDVVCSKRGYDQGGYGHFCRIWDKTQNTVILYAHCEEILISEGEHLYFQQLVALGNNTGWSTGPHLHLGFYRVDDKGNKLDRDNGYDGYLNVLDTNKAEWEVLNPKKPGQPLQLDEHEEEALALLQKFKEDHEHGNLEGAINALLGAHKDFSHSQKKIINLEKKLVDAGIKYKKKEKQMQGQIDALIEKNADKLSFKNALRIVLETIFGKISAEGWEK